MIFLYAFAVLISSYFIVGGILTLINVFHTFSDINKKKGEVQSQNDYYSIIIPVYHENMIITDTIKYFSGFSEGHDCEIFIVGTDRENEQDSGHQTTIQCASEYLKRHPEIKNVTLLSAPTAFKHKVGQMNYAFSIIRNSRNIGGYIGVYDADSRPDPKTLDCLSRLLDSRSVNGRPCPAVVQQVSSYCEKSEKLRGIWGCMALADALSQTKWALGFEYPLYKLYSWCCRRQKRVRPLIYCIGHGCFVRVSFLEKIGGFPEYNQNDDLSLGYLVSVLGEEATALPALDFCEISPDQRTTIKQYRGWYSGSARYYQDIRYYSEYYRCPLNAFQRLVFRVQGGLRNFLWAWRGMLWVLLLLCGILTGSGFLLLCVLADMVAYVILPAIATAFSLRRNGLLKIIYPRLIFTLALAPINFVIRGIGPAIASVFPAKSVQTDTYKVERIQDHDI